MTLLLDAASFQSAIVCCISIMYLVKSLPCLSSDQYKLFYVNMWPRLCFVLFFSPCQWCLLVDIALESRKKLVI